MYPIQKWAATVVAAACSFVILPAAAAPGDLDPSFGVNGSVYTPIFGNIAEPFAMVRDRSGRTIVAGQSVDPVTNLSTLLLARFLTDGTPDATFGDTGTGIVLTTPPAGVSQYAQFFSIALDSKDRIVCAGDIGTDGPSIIKPVLAVARYSPDGILDHSFNGTGFVASVIEDDEVQGMASSIAIDASDRIVAVGRSMGSSSSDGVLLRYREDGSLDHSFAKTMIRMTGVYGNFYPTSVAIDSHGQIIVAGNDVDPSTGLAVTLVSRYSDDGEQDISFGVGGFASNADLQVTQMILDESDATILGGTENTDATFALTRIDSTGTLDITFGGDGTGMAQTGYLTGVPVQIGLSLDGNGHILASANLDEGMAAFRFNVDGTPDSGFGLDGVAYGPAGSSLSVTSLIVDDADHFSMVGSDVASPDIVMLRYEN